MSEPPDPRPFAWKQTKGQASLEVQRLVKTLAYHKARTAELKQLEGVHLSWSEVRALTTGLANAGDRVRDKIAEICQVWELPFPDLYA